MPLPLSLLPEAGFQKCQGDVASPPRAILQVLASPRAAPAPTFSSLFTVPEHFG